MWVVAFVLGAITGSALTWRRCQRTSHALRTRLALAETDALAVLRGEVPTVTIAPVEEPVVRFSRHISLRV